LQVVPKSILPKNNRIQNLWTFN